MDLKKKIILDTDIGDDIDDAFALALCVNSPEIDLLGVTTVYKNTDLRAKIAKTELELYKREDIGVYAGIDKPLNQDIIAWDHETIDENGKIRIAQYLDSMSDKVYSSKSAVDFILDTLKKYPNEVTLVGIGPLTNLASAYLKDKETFKLAKEVLIMGGQLGGTYPEWNIRVDPEAARIVFTSGVKIKAVGLNVTTLCKFDEKTINYLTNLKSEGHKLIVEMMNIWLKDFKGRAPTMHDPLAISTLVSDFCEFNPYYILVELEGKERAYTKTVPASTPNSSLVYMVDKVNEQAFLDFLMERLKD